MRFLYSLVLLLIFNPQLTAGEAVRDYPVQQIADSTYVIIGPRGFPSVENQGFMNNPAWIISDQGVIVVDPGSSLQAGRMVLKRIRELTDKPVTHVFSTHVHGDHWLGNHAISELYPNATFMGHPEMIRKANDGDSDRWVSLMASATKGFTEGTKAIVPETEVNDAEMLQINGKTFRIHAPGKAHSGTDIMILESSVDRFVR